MPKLLVRRLYEAHFPATCDSSNFPTHSICSSTHMGSRQVRLVWGC